VFTAADGVTNIVIINNFAGQWLSLREMSKVETSAKEFDDNLRQSFKRETEMLFESIADR
jgi:hypothetical protein